MRTGLVKRTTGVAIAVCACTLAFAAPSFAQSSSDIVGVWEFNGGQVGVVKNPDRTFTGTVVKATTKGSCRHPIGEKMWTEIRHYPASDLNWMGRHVWYLTQPCRPAPAPGNTAWKIFRDSQGKTFLRGCYAHWEHPEIQPAIDNPGNSVTGDRGVCIDSYRLAAKKVTFRSIARFPKTSQCVGDTLKLKFVDPPTDALATVRVTVGDVTKKLKRAHLALTLKVNEGSGEVKVKVLAKTLLGKWIAGSATYKTC